MQRQFEAISSLLCRSDRAMPAGRRAVTLLELLIVIAILSLLMSTFVPSLARVRLRAKDLVCATHLRNIGLAWHFYLEDNNEGFPRWRQNMQWFYGGKHPSIWNETNTKFALPYRPLNPYADMAIRNQDSAEVFRCPMDGPIRRLGGGSGPTEGYNTYDYFGNSYMMNWQLLIPYSRSTGKYEKGQTFYLKNVSIPEAKLVVAGDCQWYYCINNVSGKLLWDASFHNENDEMNLLFLDGHVKFLQLVRGVGVTSGYSFSPREYGQ